jgi:dienelactone hydrolase
MNLWGYDTTFAQIRTQAKAFGERLGGLRGKSRYREPCTTAQRGMRECLRVVVYDCALMQGYTKRTFGAPDDSQRRIQHDVYERGAGPPIVLIQELPGIGPETLRLADKLVSAGYRVVLPHLFGPLGHTSPINVLRVFCMRREFAVFAGNASSPIVNWLRALCRDVRSSAKVRGVGVIGMCLTGNFALTLMGDESVLAAVASQPSLPFAAQSSLHMSAHEIEATRRRLDVTGPMLGFRFAGDVICTARKFDAIQAAFNHDAGRVRLETLPGRGHAVLTHDFVDETGHPTHAALRSVIAYFDRRLKAQE